MVIRVFRAHVQPGWQADFEAMGRRLSVLLDSFVHHDEAYATGEE